MDAAEITGARWRGLCGQRRPQSGGRSAPRNEASDTREPLRAEADPGCASRRCVLVDPAPAGLTRGTGAGSPLHRRPRASPRFLGADPRLPAAAPAAHSAPDSGPAQGRRVSPLLCLAGATVCPAHSVIRCQHLLAYQASAHSHVF